MAERILGVVLAGGASRRFGADKSSALLGGVPLLQRVIARASAQVDAVAVSGRAAPDIGAIPDRAPGQGPLAALAGCLHWAEAQGFALVATFACDVPFFPADLVARLRRTLAMHDGVLARSDGRGHHAAGLWRSGSAVKLARALAEGVRSFRDVGPYVSLVFCDFEPGNGPAGDAFFNINRPEDLATAQLWLTRGTHGPAG